MVGIAGSHTSMQLSGALVCPLGLLDPEHNQPDPGFPDSRVRRHQGGDDQSNQPRRVRTTNTKW